MSGVPTIILVIRVKNLDSDLTLTGWISQQETPAGQCTANQIPTPIVVEIVLSSGGKEGFKKAGKSLALRLRQMVSKLLLHIDDNFILIIHSELPPEVMFQGDGEIGIVRTRNRPVAS